MKLRRREGLGEKEGHCSTITISFHLNETHWERRTGRSGGEVLRSDWGRQMNKRHVQGHTHWSKSTAYGWQRKGRGVGEERKRHMKFSYANGSSTEGLSKGKDMNVP